MTKDDKLDLIADVKSKWGSSRSDRELARRNNCSVGTVRRYRKLFARGAFG